MNYRFAVALLLTLAPVSKLASQQVTPTPQDQTVSPAQDGQFRLKVTSQIVDLDVVVTDKNGNTVNNLTRDDFQVVEDKQPQTILNFDRPQAHVLPSNVPIESTAQLDKLTPEAPVSIIVLDELNTRFEDQAFARYSLKKYLNTQGDRLTQPTMLIAVTLQHFMVLRDYTTSKKEILNALDHHFVTNPWHLQGSWKAEQFSQSFSSLLQVAEATVGHHGHKNMIWIGRGFPSIQMADLAAADQETLENAIEMCTNMLRDARITLYTIDPAGLSVQAPAMDDDDEDDDPFGGDANFNAMATATGGQTFYGRNDVDNLIGKSVRDGNEFYTLSYKPSTRIDDPKKFRNIRIIMKNPNLTATTRKGYYVETPSLPVLGSDKKKDDGRLNFDLITASESLMVYDGLSMTITRDATQPNNFIIRFPASAIDWAAGDTTPGGPQIALVMASFDRKGKLLHREAKRIFLRPEAMKSGIAPVVLALPVQIDTAPPAARIRLVVRVGSNGKVGADNFYLTNKAMLADPTTGLNPVKRR